MRLLKKTKSTKNFERSRDNNSLSSNNKGFFSYYSNRPSTTNERQSRERVDTFDQKTKSNNRSLKHAPTILAILLILISIVYSTVLSLSNPKIVQLSETSPTILKSNDYYQKEFSKVLGQSFWNNSKLTINTKGIEDEIISLYPEVSEVAINIPIVGKRPVIQISPTKPRFIISSNTGEYAVGNNGKVLMSVNDIPEQLKAELTKIQDKVITDPTVGDVILPNSTIEFINQVSYQLSSKNLDIEYIELPAIANELHIKPKGVDYIVKLNLQSDAREQVGSFLAISERINSGTVARPKEYIDVRVEERVYIK